MRRIGMLIATTLGAAVLAAGPTASADIPQQPDQAPAPAEAGTQTPAEDPAQDPAQDPAGTQTEDADAKSCVKADTSPSTVTNQTEGVALIFDAPDCTGHVLGAMLPGETKDLTLGQSVLFVQ
ncbi:hypothetical protein ACFYS8_19685 [Kitasatospora sp. NPDC004615]|uniref:hypothetical protein n=1 Tax=Kitasatospora sp. NPDC004615 TaxID=3364017 RepID=UPI00367D01C7